MNRTLYTLLFHLGLPLVALRLFLRARKAPAYGQRIGERFAFNLPAMRQGGIHPARNHGVGLGPVREREVHAKWFAVGQLRTKCEGDPEIRFAGIRPGRDEAHATCIHQRSHIPRVGQPHQAAAQDGAQHRHRLQAISQAAEPGCQPHRIGPFEEALRHMADRTAVDEIRAFATLLIQSDKLGSSIATTLRIYASEMREKRRMRAEEKAARLPAIMTVPLILFILPALFIVIIGPAACSIGDAFSKQ